MRLVSLLLIKSGRAALTLWFVVSFTFVVLRLSGDSALVMLPSDASAEAIQQFRALKGLDRSFLVQYLDYVGSMFAGDFGRSFLDGRPAITVVMEKVPKTLAVGGLGLALMLLIGAPLGLLAALKRNSLVDRGTIVFAVIGHSVPSYVIGLILIGIFAVSLRLLPSTGSETAAHAILPIVTFGIYGGAVIARFVRSSVLEVVEQPHVRTALAKGISRQAIILRHVLPNAAIPVVTILGFLIGGLIGGSVLIETVFGWSGVGRLLATSVANRDLPVVQTILFSLATTMIAANLAVDVINSWLDPRARPRLGG